jgi:hypothetical protein
MASNRFHHQSTQSYRNKAKTPIAKERKKVTVTLPKKEKIKDNKYHIIFNPYYYCYLW